MEKLPMCRICLVEDVHMYVVVNKNLHKLYEKLTDVPFVTEDRRPMLACSFCCTKLKQCWRFMSKCLEAEKLFAQMMDEDYEADSLINQEHLEFFNGLINSPMVHISIFDGCPTESDAIKEELPDGSEGLDDIIDPLTEEEHQTDKLELDNAGNSYPDVEDTPALHAESDSEDASIKTEVEDEQESTGVPVAKKPKLNTRRPKAKDQTSNRTTKFKKPSTETQDGVGDTINNAALSKSFRNNSNRDNIKCKISYKGIGSDKIRKHQSVCVNEKRFECDICQRRLNTKSHLITHIRTHTGEKPFKCDICQRSFNQKSHLVNHTRTHTGEKPFKCDICQRSFNKKSHLVNHTRTHTGEKPFKCDICQRSFSRKNYLVTHTRTHTGEKPFNCDICQRSFNEKQHLVSHTRTHTGEKPFNCDICQRSFSQKNRLVSHTRTHTGEKPFNCDICQRSFSQNYHLVSHTRTHTGEKPFNCDICQRSFSQKNRLVSHTRTHTGEKPFNYDIMSV